MKILFDKSSYVRNLRKFLWLFKFIRKSFIACSSLIKGNLIRYRLSGSELFIFSLYFCKGFCFTKILKMLKTILILYFFYSLRIDHFCISCSNLIFG